MQTPQTGLVVRPPPTMVDQSESLEAQILRARRQRADAKRTSLFDGQY